MLENLNPESVKIDITTGRVEVDSADQSQEAREVRELDQILDGVAHSILDYSLNVQSGDRLLIKMSPNGWQLASKVMSEARARGAEVRILTVDTRFLLPTTRTVLESVSDALKGKNEAAFTLPLAASENSPSVAESDASMADKATAFIHHGMLTDELAGTAWATQTLTIRESISTSDSPTLEPVYRKGQSAIAEARGDNVPWCLIYVPTQEEATLAGMSLFDYSKMYYEASDRPWEEVEKAQATFVEMLQEGKEFHVEAGAPEGWDQARWSTKITMNIENMIGVNMTAHNNVPGSEVFLAPNAGTLEGQYTLPYPVRFGQRVLPNLGLRFEKGKVVEFWIKDAQPGDEDYVRNVLATAGADAVGELGIGTNPKIDHAYLNTLLVEKAGGSIHLALGNAYQLTEFRGRVVKVDNGNRSKENFHIDLTRMMTPKYGGGRMSITRPSKADPQQAETIVLQEDGRFLDDRLAVLNPTA